MKAWSDTEHIFYSALHDDKEDIEAYMKKLKRRLNTRLRLKRHLNERDLIELGILNLVSNSVKFKNGYFVIA